MIGIMDSGIGGLTVAKTLMEQLPGYDMIYFGDTARSPYGTKSADTVLRYTAENTELLLNNGAKLIVIACNTTSSVAAEHVAKRYDVPVLEAVTPAVTLSVKASKNLRIGVMATRTTVESQIYEKKIFEINAATTVYAAACPLLVPLAEEGWLKKPEAAMIVKKYLRPLKVKQIDTLILGSTHYSLLKDNIQRKIGKRVKIIDSSIALANEITEFLKDRPEVDALLGKNAIFRAMVSDITDQHKINAKVFFKKNITIEHVLP